VNWIRLRGAALLLGAATALALVDSVQSHLAHAHWPNRDPFGFRFTHTLPPWIIAALLVPAVAAVVKRWPLQLTVRSVALHLISGSTFAVVHFALLALFHRFVLWPGQPVLPTIRLFLLNYFVFYLLLYWAAAGAVQSLQSARALRKREQAALELTARLAEARLDALRAQLNPHFLFNVLNSAAMLARKGKPAEVVTVLARLGDLLRYVLREGSRGETTLQEELEFLRSYLELERVRFGDRLTVRFEADPGLSPLRVPSLILQPLVENAVRHGISCRPGAGRIEIRARRAGARMQLEIRDDGPGLSPQRANGTGGIGIRNTRERLKERYGAAAELTLRTLPEGGTAALVSLPCEVAA